jgi:hypothetical protein
MLAVAGVLVLAAFGASDLQPSALRLAVTTVIGLIAPLFWPGNAATPARTALRIAAWSAAVACMAAIALRIAGNPGQPFARILAAGGMRLLILLVTHAAAAVVRWRPIGGAETAREMASRAARARALVGSLPSGSGLRASCRRQPWIIDAAIGINPSPWPLRAATCCAASGSTALESGRAAIFLSWLGRCHRGVRAILRCSYFSAGIAAPAINRRPCPDLSTMEPANDKATA